MTMRSITILTSLLLFAACAADEPAVDDTAVTETAQDLPEPVVAESPTATADVQDADGNQIGTLTLAAAGQTIEISGMLHGLAPGTHAIHLHETGLCEPPFQSAGGHWNPTSHEHGSENPQGPHLGDFLNFEVGADSMATVQVSSPVGATLQGANGLLDADGAAVVVHAGPDDYRTNPSGDSGDRIACGVVTAI